MHGFTFTDHLSLLLLICFVLSQHLTYIVPYDSPQPSVILSNTTSYALLLSFSASQTLFSICPQSSLRLSSSNMLFVHHNNAPILCNGLLTLSSISLSTSEFKNTLPPLASCTFDPSLCCYLYSASLQMRSSTFADFSLSIKDGSLVNSGFTCAQSVQECTFTNITCVHTHNHDISYTPKQETLQCSLHDSELSGCENAFYGCIIAGIPYTTSDFAASNTTFIHCSANPNNFPFTTRMLLHPISHTHPIKENSLTSQQSRSLDVVSLGASLRNVAEDLIHIKRRMLQLSTVHSLNACLNMVEGRFHVGQPLM